MPTSFPIDASCTSTAACRRYAGEAVVPAPKLSDTLKQIRGLLRMLGLNTMEAEILKETVEIAPSRRRKGTDLIAGRLPVKLVSE
jgi:hypothetical protein